MGEAVDFRTMAAKYSDVLRTAVPDEPVEHATYPEFTGDDGLVQYAGMGQGIRASADDQAPIGATDGLATCIGTVLYDAARQEAFISHTASGDATATGEDPHIASFYDDMAGTERSLDVTYVMGNIPDMDVFESVRATVHTHQPDGIDITDETLVYTGRSGSIAIDTRTGERFTYNRPTQSWLE